MTTATASKARANRSSKAATEAAEAAALQAAAEAAAAEAAAEPTLEELVMQVKQNWMLANDAEAAGKKGVQAAKLSLDNTRVLKSRVAFMAAQLGSKAANGLPSLAGATRILYCTADMDAAAQKKEIENKKASVRLYWAAAQALDALGLAHETGEPTDAEREAVLTAFRNGKKKAPRVDDGSKAAGESDSEKTPATPDTVEVTADSFLPFIAGLNATLTAVKAKKVPVSEEQAAEMSALVQAFIEQLSEYAS